MDLEIITLNEVSQRKTNIIRYCLHVESKKKKKVQMNLFTKQKQTQDLGKDEFMVTGGKMGRRDRLVV